MTLYKKYVWLKQYKNMNEKEKSNTLYRLEKLQHSLRKTPMSAFKKSCPLMLWNECCLVEKVFATNSSSHKYEKIGE